MEKLSPYTAFFNGKVGEESQAMALWRQAHSTRRPFGCTHCTVDRRRKVVPDSARITGIWSSCYQTSRMDPDDGWKKDYGFYLIRREPAQFLG